VRGRAGCAALLLSLALAGCGGGGDTATSSPLVTASPAPSGAATPLQAKVTYQTAGVNGFTAATQTATLTVSEPGATGPFAVTVDPSSTAPITVTPVSPQTASSAGGAVTFTLTSGTTAGSGEIIVSAPSVPPVTIDYTVTISSGSIG
jgi:hypothetical protein